jgi:hypothetical protein
MKTWHWWMLWIVVLASVAAEMIVPHEGEHAWYAVPGFYGVFGFAGCVIIIYFSKLLGKMFILKREDYYDVR